MATSECRFGIRAGVCHRFWLVAHRGARLALRADGVGEARHTRVVSARTSKRDFALLAHGVRGLVAQLAV
jgi:hypothetical protein